MKIILVGYPGSQFIIPASRYLVEKYLPGFDLVFLNYEGEKEGWSNFIREYLKGIRDPYVILALDDYLISDHFNKDLYEASLQGFKDKRIVCIKLCETTWEEHLDYPVTTQYTIWDRHFLISLLSQTKDPWHFEMTGSSIFKQTDRISVCTKEPVIKYDVHSCLSSRWPGIKWDGVKQEDIDYIKNNNLIK